ncbi:TWiK family of potassium channels protein 12-like [Daktulosphaira vitifoliae]|uniref:TWiK family of potassium channels protein 12-like n=1 Tax=Daktulosphaira vitifoliae TaxID=58002 RepID=UPI0021AAC9E3|nr:TWiK family of potassium channels protein 12-like [Daktulosphaira vitifoliae]
MLKNVYFRLCNVTPQTPWGRVITILYALIGITLMLLYLSTMGETLAKNFRRIYSRMCSVPSRRDEEDDERQDSRRKRLPPNTVSSNHIGTTGGSGGDFIDYYRYDFETITGSAALPPISLSSANISFSNQKRVPILLSLSIVGLYVTLGAYIYHKLEKWTLLEGSYFCFTSLGTIGFGELVPGGVEATKDVSVFVSSGYILIGMAIVAMCFQLLQDELAAIARNFRWWWWSSRKEFEDAANSNDSVLIVSPTHNS